MPICPACAQEVTHETRRCPSCGAPVQELSSTVTRAPRRRASSGERTAFGPGDRLAGRYRIVLQVGKDGMGDVYRAYDLELGQEVALKFLPTDLQSDTTRLERFRRDVRARANMGLARPYLRLRYDESFEVTPMRPFLTLAGFLLVVTLASTGCDDNTTSGFTAPTDVTFDLADLAEILFARGVPIEVGDEEVVNFFPVPARHFKVFDDDVLVFEFVGPNAAAAVAGTVSSDGTTINGQVIDWPATPHFFLSGQVIVLYLGDDARVIFAIQDVMGAQFAGGEVVFTVEEPSSFG